MFWKLLVALVGCLILAVLVGPVILAAYCFANGFNHAGAAAVVFSAGTLMTVTFLQVRRVKSERTKDESAQEVG